MKRPHGYYPSSNRMTFATVEIHNNDLEFREQKRVKEILRLIALFLLYKFWVSFHAFDCWW